LRTQSEIPAALQDSSATLDLIADTKPSGSDEARNLRNLALAYAQVGAKFSEYDEKALQILESAATAFPDDAEVQATYGKALILTHSGKNEIAAVALQRAIDSGSRAPDVRTMLARLLVQQHQVSAARDLYKQAIQLDPYFAPAYLDLAHLYVMLKDPQHAIETLDSVLKVDPGNDAARELRNNLDVGN
jgi:tetratricopeptide (TPR) repeat protein